MRRSRFEVRLRRTLREMGKPLVVKGHGPRSRKITRSQLPDSETGIQNEGIDPSIEVAAAPDVLPHRRETILPGSHLGVLGETVLQKNQNSTRPQDSL